MKRALSVRIGSALSCALGQKNPPCSATQTRVQNETCSVDEKRFMQHFE